MDVSNELLLVSRAKHSSPHEEQTCSSYKQEFSKGEVRYRFFEGVKYYQSNSNKHIQFKSSFEKNAVCLKGLQKHGRTAAC